MSTTKSPSSRPIATTATFARTSSSALLSLLHLPELLIQLNPLVESFHLTESSKTSSSPPSLSGFPVGYAITDRIPLLGGLWSTRTSYTARFTPSPEGMLVDVTAAMGVTTKSVWSVRKSEDGAGSEVTEESEVTIAGGSIWEWMMRGYIEGQIKSSHAVLIGRLREKVAEKEGDA